LDNLSHSKILIWFFIKNLVVFFEKRPFKFFFQKTFLLKTSFALARILFFQTLVFDLLKLLLCWFSLKFILGV